MSCVAPTPLCAIEKGSLYVTFTFEDEDGESVTPDSATWSLTDGGGGIVNSRGDVSLSPATSVSFWLKGDDLPWQGSDATATYSLYLLCEALYTSGSESSIPLNQEIEIQIRNLRAVS